MSRRCFTGLTRVSLRRADGHLPLLARALTSQRSQTRRKHSSSGSNSSSSSNLDASKESTTTASTSTPTPSDDAQSTKKAADLSGLKHQVEHRATETIGIRLTERVVERIAEAAELGAEKTAASRTLAAVAKRAGRAATNTITPAAAAAPRGILGSLPVRTAVARVGRGFLIALPLAGAGFAAWIGRSDYRRTRQELELARARLALAEEKHNNSEVDVGLGRVTSGAGVAASRPTLDTATVRCFGVATAADSVNVVAHLVAVYGLYQGWAPEGIVNAESVGLVSAVVSTGGAVRGEYLAALVGSECHQHGDGGDDDTAAGSPPKERTAGEVRGVDKTGGGSQ